MRSGGWRMSSNYPPGVTGNEPEITGEWPCECDRDPDCKKCDGKGFVNGDEAIWNVVLDCPNCGHHTLELFTDDWLCSRRCEGPDTPKYDIDEVIKMMEDDA